jgi:CHRD domain
VIGHFRRDRRWDGFITPNKGVFVSFRRTVLTIAVCAVLFSGAAQAAELAFTAALRGDAEPTMTGSTARGDATIAVDTATQTIDVALRVTGISFDDLFDQVVNSPAGSIHMHHYGANGDVTLIVPFPMGPTYTETSTGFVLTVKDYPYAAGAKVLDSAVTFEQFLASLNSGGIVLNIHTDKFQAGEIGGYVKPVK